MIERLKHLIEDAYGHAAASKRQLIASDDPIISDHIRDSEAILKRALKLLRELEAESKSQASPMLLEPDKIDRLSKGLCRSFWMEEGDLTWSSLHASVKHRWKRAARYAGGFMLVAQKVRELEKK